MAQEHSSAKATEITNEQDVQGKIDAVGEDILSSLDLDIGNQEEKPGADGGEVKLKADFKEELAEEEEDEEEEEESEESEEEVEEEEDVIARSKFEKYQAKMEKRINKLTAEKHELEEAKPKDSTRIKLEKKTEAELEQIDEEIDDAIFEARTSGDNAKVRELKDLRKDVRDVVKTAPQRFAKAQQDAYNEKVSDITDLADDDGIDLNKEAGAIKSIAANIYQRNKAMRGLKEGQAMALELAYEHYKVQRQLGQGQSKEGDLKRKVTKLKKKVSLDSSKSTATKRGSSLKSKFKKAKGGDYDAKADFLGEIINIDSYLT